MCGEAAPTPSERSRPGGDRARVDVRPHAGWGITFVSDRDDDHDGTDDLDDHERAFLHYVIGAHRLGLIDDHQLDDIRALARLHYDDRSDVDDGISAFLDNDNDPVERARAGLLG